MLETNYYQMVHLPFNFLKHPLVGITLAIPLLISFCCCCIFSSTILTLLVLVLPSTFSFIFSKIKLFYKAGAVENSKELEVDVKTTVRAEDEIPKEKNETLEVVVEEDVLQINELACSSPEPSLVCRGLEGPEMERLLLQSDMFFMPLQCSDSSLSDAETSPENASQLSGCSEGSISDDDNLIEIVLPDGNFHGTEEPNGKGAFLPNCPLEALFRQHELKDLLSEINEEDNLIEIDITMGSIKCSRVEIKA